MFRGWLLAVLAAALAPRAAAAAGGARLPVHWRASEGHARDAHPAEHRRLQEAGAFLEDGLIGGNTAQLGYFYVTLEVGTPPQRQTVILDTGSHVTAFPCSTCAKNCGSHMDKPFDVAQSSTASKLKCGAKGCTCRGGECTYSVRYTEGSSISGVYYTDKVWVEPTPPPAKLALEGTGADRYGADFNFGCHKRETKLFRTQRADGIFGAGNTPNNLIYYLKKAGKVDKAVFSICLAREGGVFTLGGVDERMLLAPLAWAKMGNGRHYTVQVTDMEVDGASLGVGASLLNKGYGGFMLDTGTTYSYFNTKVLAALKTRIDKVCAQAGRCQGKKTTQRSEHHCWAVPDADDLSSFPDMRVPLKDGGAIDIKPRQYLSRVGKSYCVGYYSNGNGGNLLGGNVMRDHVFEFDLEGKRVGIAPADCDPADLASAEGAGGGGGAGQMCLVSEWGEWGECAGGTHTRERTVEREPSHGGAACPPLAETEECARVLGVAGAGLGSGSAAVAGWQSWAGVGAVAAAVVVGAVVRQRRARRSLLG